MKMHHFVSGSGVMIAGWLMLTFVHEVSPQQYPQRRRSMPAHATSNGVATPANAPQNAVTENTARLAESRGH